MNFAQLQKEILSLLNDYPQPFTANDLADLISYENNDEGVNLPHANLVRKACETLEMGKFLTRVDTARGLCWEARKEDEATARPRAVAAQRALPQSKYRAKRRRA